MKSEHSLAASPRPRDYFILTDSLPHFQELFSFTQQTFTEPLPDARPRSRPQAPSSWHDSPPAPRCPPNSDANSGVAAPGASGDLCPFPATDLMHRPAHVPAAHHGSRGCYSRAPSFGSPACGLASLQGPREGAGHRERAQGPAAWGRGGEGREEREGEAGEGVQRHREREKGQGGAGSCSRPRPAVTTASSEQSQTQSGGRERTP